MQSSDDPDALPLNDDTQKTSETCSVNYRTLQTTENRPLARPRSDGSTPGSRTKSRPLSVVLLPVASNGVPEIPSDHLQADASLLRPSPQRTPSPLRRPVSQPTLPTQSQDIGHSRGFAEHNGLESSKVDKFMEALAVREGNVIRLKQQINALKQELSEVESKLVFAENDVENMRAKGSKIFKNFADRERDQAIRYLAAQQELSDQAARLSAAHTLNKTTPVRDSKRISQAGSERPRQQFGETLIGSPSAGSRRSNPDFSRTREPRSPLSPDPRQWMPSTSSAPVRAPEVSHSAFDHSIEQATDELLDLGKKIIGGVGNQFMELFRDVKLATIGEQSHTAPQDPHTPRTRREALRPNALATSEQAGPVNRMRFIHTAAGHISPGQMMPESPSQERDGSKYS